MDNKEFKYITTLILILITLVITIILTMKYIIDNSERQIGRDSIEVKQVVKKDRVIIQVVDRKR